MNKRDQIKLREKDKKKSYRRDFEKELFCKDEEFLFDTITELTTDDQIETLCFNENVINDTLLICSPSCPLLGNCSLIKSNKYDVI